jgi:hypothetical protein
MRDVVAAAAMFAAFSLPVSVFAAGGFQPQNPYASLFTGQLNAASNPRPTPVPAVPFVLPPLLQSAPSQTVACGLTVMQGDSKIDPAMPHRPPANAPNGSIKIIPSLVCGH